VKAQMATILGPQDPNAINECSAPSAGSATRRYSSFAHLSNAIDEPDFRLCDQPFTGTGQLPLGWKVVSSFRTISLGSASSAHGHSPVRLWHMVVIELASCVNCSCCGHAAPIGRRIECGPAAISKKCNWHPIGPTLSFGPPYAQKSVRRRGAPKNAPDHRVEGME
jgi:hypothetical protein